MFKLFQNLEQNSKKKKSRSILIGSIVAVIIALTPLIFYYYKFFPSGSTLDLYFFTYESKYQLSITTVMWLFMAKFVPLILLVLWFFTCKHWWYHVLLIPISMFTFQIVSLIYEDRFIDEVEIYWLLPIMTVIIPFVYLIRLKLFDKHVLGIDLEAMDRELKAYKEKEIKEKERLQKEEMAKEKIS
ncbi:hypothetical protein H4O18_09205 [Arenibacter sp. BSSL-BM3]|uniref:Uncharacterized protein n=1 Tax=Arenibacter arenosicollis TaxID=2762274 RepID=A0ABR7QLV5_9FLAO|nr:hypothetical protein [Arenibacter arenosicollis]MBC8768168.1 hypothetical protein [Arenibacter arenosicollis]